MPLTELMLHLNAAIQMSHSVSSECSCGEVTGPALGVAGNQGPQGSEFIIATVAPRSRWGQSMVIVIM
jgi:hypothetical protein